MPLLRTDFIPQNTGGILTPFTCFPIPFGTNSAIIPPTGTKFVELSIYITFSGKILNGVVPTTGPNVIGDSSFPLVKVFRPVITCTNTFSPEPMSTFTLSPFGISSSAQMDITGNTNYLYLNTFILPISSTLYLQSHKYYIYPEFVGNFNSPNGWAFSMTGTARYFG